jgi:transposase
MAVNSLLHNAVFKQKAVVNRMFCREAMVALYASYVPIKAIASLIGCSTSTVHRWIHRSDKTIDLNDNPRSGRPGIYSETIQLKIIAFYCQTQPLPGCGRWSLRWAAAYLNVHSEQISAAPSKSTIHRILMNNQLKPHQSRYFLHITDPNFFPKMEHLVSLYLHPPKHLFFFDECPGIQILKRLTPDLRTEQMKRRLEEFEYIRNGTMDVFAFLDNADGKVYAECHGDHTTATFLDVFEHHVSKFPKTEKLHYVMDNLSTHRGYRFCQKVAALSNVHCPCELELNTVTKRVAWLQASDKRIVIHFTPFHGSWLNLVEIWFGIMNRKLLSESFDSAEMLKEAFTSWLNEWNCLLAHPFQWTYDGKGLHEKAVKRFIAMLNNAAAQIEIRILTKKLQLMTNMLDSYLDKVDTNIWKQLVQALQSHQVILSSRIQMEDGCKKKEKAKDALAGLIAALRKCFGKTILIPAA